MVGTYDDRNPFDENENPFADPAIRAQAENNASLNIPMGGAKEAKRADRDSTRREEALDRREAALDRREAELIKREEELARAGYKRKNWPPLIPLKLIHHDIPADIPPHLQSLQTTAYIAWLGLLVALFWNFIAVTAAWVHWKFSLGTYGVQIWLLAIIYIMSGVPMSYKTWYRPLYSALKKGSIFKFGRFFIFFPINILFNIYAAVAPPIVFKGVSLTGILSAIRIFPHSTAVGVLYFIGFILFTFDAVLSIWVLIQVFRHVRTPSRQSAANRQAAIQI